MTEKVPFVVAPGRTIRHDGNDHGPGATIMVSPEDATHLEHAGFGAAPHANGAAAIEVIHKVPVPPRTPRDAVLSAGSYGPPRQG